MIIAKTLVLFVLTAIAEIVGCYLPYLWLKKDGSGLAADSRLRYLGLKLGSEEVDAAVRFHHKSARGSVTSAS